MGRKNGMRREPFTPNNGGVVLTIEFDRRILGELRRLADDDGLGSIYQEIRNACYSYVEGRRGKPVSTKQNVGIVGRIGSLLGGRGESVSRRDR